jgi:hypothetical protein
MDPFEGKHVIKTYYLGVIKKVNKIILSQGVNISAK